MTFMMSIVMMMMYAMRKVIISMRMIAKWSVRDGAFNQKEKYESLFREKEQLHTGSPLQLPSPVHFHFHFIGWKKNSLSLFSPHFSFPSPPF